VTNWNKKTNLNTYCKIWEEFWIHTSQMTPLLQKMKNSIWKFIIWNFRTPPKESKQQKDLELQIEFNSQVKLGALECQGKSCWQNMSSCPTPSCLKTYPYILGPYVLGHLVMSLGPQNKEIFTRLCVSVPQFTSSRPSCPRAFNPHVLRPQTKP
jgi:hypothetical protein